MHNPPEPIAAATRRIVIDAGWRPGTTLENIVALWLHRGGWTPAQVAQQHRVGAYRIDFAWTRSFIALEVDGWHHRSPEGAARDAMRDSWLRHNGWLVFRIDDRHGEESLLDQLVDVSRLVHVVHEDRAVDVAYRSRARNKSGAQSTAHREGLSDAKSA